MPHPTEPPPPSRRPLRWGLLVPALVMPLFSSFFYFVYYPGTTLGQASFTFHKLFLLLWPSIAVFLILKEPLYPRPAPPRHLASLLPGGAFAFLVLGLLFGLLYFSPFGAVFEANRGRIVQRIHDLGAAENYLAFALFISVLHAAMEEYYWRGFVFSQAARLLPRGAAHLVAALGFAAHHVVVVSQFFPLPLAFLLGACVAAGGAFWSWQLERYRSLLGPWFGHLLIDLGLMWVGWEALRTAS